MNLILRWIIITMALVAAAWVIPGIRIEADRGLLVMAVIFGFVNALIRPLVDRLPNRHNDRSPGYRYTDC